jgi:hypothetical protein
MVEWTKAKEAAAREYHAMHKAAEGYGYGEGKAAEKTDLAVRRIAAKSINEAKDELFPLIESSYLGRDFDSAGALNDIMQWLDLLLLEMDLRMLWKADADYRGYVVLIRSDAALIRGAEKIAASVKGLKTAGKGRGGVKKACAEIKESIAGLMMLLKRRRHSLGG